MNPLPPPAELAQQQMLAHQQAEHNLALAYKTVFESKHGKKVLADLQKLFPHDRPRFDPATTRANPIAAFMGGVHFDGSAAVTKHIHDQIKAAEIKPKAPPTIQTS